MVVHRKVNKWLDIVKVASMCLRIQTRWHLPLYSSPYKNFESP